MNFEIAKHLLQYHSFA